MADEAKSDALPKGRVVYLGTIALAGGKTGELWATEALVIRATTVEFLRKQGSAFGKGKGRSREVGEVYEERAVTNPSVTFTGTEVAILAGLIAGSLPTLEDDDFEVADHLLDKALAGLAQPLSDELAAKIERQRVRPNERFWSALIETIPPGQPFDIVDAGTAAGVTFTRAFLTLEALHGKEPRLRRVDSAIWEITP